MNFYFVKSELERGSLLLLFLLGTLAVVGNISPAHAEYGDLVLNQHAEKEGMPPVIFPHWFHRIRFRCKVCHADLGFKFKAGGSGINMLKIIDGQYCGACHNGEIAWSVENCDLCHTGKDGLKTQVDGSTLSKLVVPVKDKNKKPR
ncbi:MAG TPA: hypothetical protein ENI68_06800 [Gammaproteobacteria bacterium]|nr:hypothetical protein [Gammaproteobacteria bacterium]